MLIRIKEGQHNDLIGELLEEHGIEFEVTDAYTEVCEDIMNSVAENINKPEGISDEAFKEACNTVLDLIIRKYDFQDLIDATQDYLNNELENEEVDE